MKAKINVVILTLVILIGIGFLAFSKTEGRGEAPLWGGGFEKYEGNPILSPQGTGFEAKATFNPAVILVDGTFYMFYRAEDWTGEGKWNGQSTLGLARSKDGIKFWRRSEPVIVPSQSYEIPGGCEDPRIVKIDGTYYLTYT
ncbi:MAG TPA: glycosidase, partial [Thermoplasmata archaeon]|nr:glycosidase [Thermoplasmata archaeon]